MTTTEQEEVNAFVLKALRTLQMQNDELKDLIDAHEGRIHVLERQNMWNLFEGNMESPPPDMFVGRTANGRLCVRFHEERERETSDPDN